MMIGPIMLFVILSFNHKRQLDKVRRDVTETNKKVVVSSIHRGKSAVMNMAISFLACHIAGAPVHVFSRFKKRWVERSAACPVEARTMFSADEIVSAQRLEE
ncbi:unnamed protein product [Brassica oleracea]